MKRLWGIVLSVVMAAVMVSSAMAVDFSFHGDLNNRFLLYTNHVDFFQPDHKGTLSDGETSDNFAEIKYRFWFDAATDDGKVKGVFATEIGGLRFGESGKAAYSGDSIAMEVRWAYLDFQFPNVENPARVRMGLQPIEVSPYNWQETIAGVKFYGEAAGMGYELAWLRGHEVQVNDSDDDREDADALYGRLNIKPNDGLDVGLFAMYQGGDADASSPADNTVSSRDWQVKKFADKVDLNLWTLGVDGGMTSGKLFVNWDLMYQMGNIDNITFSDYASGLSRSGDFDMSAYFAHLDVGMKIGAHKITYTFWYASGDDDARDGDINAYVATDLDRTDSVCLMEGGYLDDDYFTERPYVLDKGLILNKLALDTKLCEKSRAGIALLYMMTAEDIAYTDSLGRPQSESSIGMEVDAYYARKIYKNVDFELSLGYLVSDGALDFFEEVQDGDAEEDIFNATSRIRYKF